MADGKQFGNPKILQFGDKTAGNRAGDSGHCAECEAMLADALDGTLSAADQALFDAHMSECGPCGQLLADARRGAAFLEILRHPAPEPPAALLERILVETSGRVSPAHTVSGVQAAPHMVGGVAALTPGYAAAGKVLPFRVRAGAALRRSGFGQILLQPRLAMTAAMAFFSVTLTMNLMGIHPLQLRASDLTPSSLKRDITSADASVVRYYEGLRVVYELESRVHDLQTAQETDQPNEQPGVQPGAQPAAPSSRPSGGPAPATPASQKDAPQPDRTNQPDGGHQPEQKKAAPGPGSSRREDLDRSRRLVLAGARVRMRLGDVVAVTGKRTLV